MPLDHKDKFINTVIYSQLNIFNSHNFNPQDTLLRTSRNIRQGKRALNYSETDSSKDAEEWVTLESRNIRPGKSNKFGKDLVAA